MFVFDKGVCSLDVLKSIRKLGGYSNDVYMNLAVIGTQF